MAVETKCMPYGLCRNIPEFGEKGIVGRATLEP